MGAARDGPPDLVEMVLHGLGLGERHDQSRPDAARRADRAKQKGALVALIGRLPGTRAPPGPLPDDPVLLPDPSLVLEPDLDRLLPGKVREVGSQRGREVFLKAAIVSAFWPGCRGRALMWEKPICLSTLPTVLS